MHGLVDADQRFLARRRRLVSSWNRMGAILLLALGALLAWLTLQTPWMVNPLHVAKALERGAVDPARLELAALLLPVVVLFLFLVVLVFVFLGFAIMRNERRYLALIEQLLREQQARSPGHCGTDTVGPLNTAMLDQAPYSHTTSPAQRR